MTHESNYRKRRKLLVLLTARTTVTGPFIRYAVLLGEDRLTLFLIWYLYGMAFMCSAVWVSSDMIEPRQFVHLDDQ